MVFKKLTTDGYLLEMKLTPELKSRIKKVFGKAHGLTLITLSTIKKKYPRLNFTKVQSWYTVLADCLEKIEREEKVEKPLHETVKEAIEKAGLQTGKLDSLMGYIYEVFAGNQKIGLVGYSSIRGSFVFHSPTGLISKYGSLDFAISVAKSRVPSKVAVAA